MKCTDCDAELHSVYAARSVELARVAGETWIEKNVFSAGCSCPNCHAELDADTLDELGVPIEYR